MRRIVMFLQGMLFIRSQLFARDQVIRSILPDTDLAIHGLFKIIAKEIGDFIEKLIVFIYRPLYS